MKKKTVVLSVIIILCLITVVFSSCGNKETKIIYDGNLNKVNFNYMSDGVTFMLTFASTDENIEIGETSFHGVNTANIMPIKYNNEAVAREEQKNLTSKAKKDGYYLHMIAVGVTVIIQDTKEKLLFPKLHRISAELIMTLSLTLRQSLFIFQKNQRQDIVLFVLLLFPTIP